MIRLTDEEIDQVWPDFPTELIDRECPLSQDELEIIARQIAIATKVVAKAQLKKVAPDVEEVIRVLGKVVPSDQNAMIEWAVKSQDSVYTNAGAAYRLLLELRQALLEEVK